MKQVILGTAGHIDHGKTALIKALTGVDTDRLKEEKARGITIELGFCSLPLPDGNRIGIVDVPGHERFVKTMVAGATGIDIVLLVIAADESIMPQTREHLNICRLLNIRSGLITLTKVDLVEEEWIELVEDDIRGFVEGTFLEGAPILRVSAVTGQGVPELISAIHDLAEKVEGKSPEGYFRLPIDRVFVMKGFGSVVTGTLVSGTLSLGDTFRILPTDLQSKVRGIEVYNQEVNRSTAGLRTAVNLQGVEKDIIHRGDVLVHPDIQIQDCALMVDAFMEYLPGQRPLKNRTRVRLHIGTSEIFGNMILFDREEIKGGERAEVQIRLEKPTVAFYGDPFVIRSYSPVQTIGGGIVLDSRPKKHKRFSMESLAHLEELSKGDLEQVIEIYTRESGFSGITLKGLKGRIILPEREWKRLIKTLKGSNRLIGLDGGEALFLHRSHYDQLVQKTLDLLEVFHKKHPLEAGLSKEELRTKLPRSLLPKAFNALLGDLVRKGLFVMNGDRISLSTHQISLGKREKELIERLERMFAEAGLQPPTLSEVDKTLEKGKGEVKGLLDLLDRQGSLIRVKDTLYFHVSAISKLQHRLVAFLRGKGEISPTEFKEMTGVSRKFMIPLLEYFDAQKLTVRVGDKRRLRERTK